MTKKKLIALADSIKNHKNTFGDCLFKDHQIKVLADFCQSQNVNFKRDRWIDYINGECGKNGGKVKGRG